MKVRTKVWINDHDNKVIFGNGRLQILEAIDHFGSMNRAAKKLNMSYRALWGRIKATEERLGAKVVITKPGSGREGGAVVAPAGKKLIENYRLLEDRIIKFAGEEFEKIFCGVQGS